MGRSFMALLCHLCLAKTAQPLRQNANIRLQALYLALLEGHGITQGLQGVFLKDQFHFQFHNPLFHTASVARRRPGCDYTCKIPPVGREHSPARRGQLINSQGIYHMDNRARPDRPHPRLSGRRLFLTGLLCLACIPTVLASALPEPFKAPEFTHRDAAAWINSPPLTLQSLQGRVVLLDFWTFACWNCYRSFPWLKQLEASLHAEDFSIIGVHSPEFSHERLRFNVEEKVDEFGLQHPVMMDNDHSYWRAMSNSYWPAFYLLDRQGRVRGYYVGETHVGDRNAVAIEAHIRALLKEAPATED